VGGSSLALPTKRCWGVMAMGEATHEQCSGWESKIGCDSFRFGSFFRHSSVVDGGYWGLGVVGIDV
jgi:hypothetical protein